MRAISLCEHRTLELQYDGPIPPHALADLRSCPPRPFAYAGLTDRELELWVRLVRSNLKAEQRRLAERRQRLAQVRAVMTCDAGAKARAQALAYTEALWSLQQCVAARAEGKNLHAEAKRRTTAAHLLSYQVRTLKAMEALF